MNEKRDTRALAVFGRIALDVLRVRGFGSLPDLDSDGFEKRSPHADGMAAAGFREIRDLALAAGLFDEDDCAHPPARGTEEVSCPLCRADLGLDEVTP